nr:hybrid signal transduction histidine kinase M [Tanacetum cinerariifolium]
MYYFSHICHGYGILDHLVDPVASSSTATPTDPPPKDAKWTKIDFIIRYWIFSTLTPTLRKCLIYLNPTTSKDAWTYIAGIFQDNKRPRAMALKAELRNLKLRDLSIDGVYLPPMKRSLPLLLVGNPFPISKRARRGPSLEKVNNPCWSFAKGSCRLGDACKYLYNGVHDKSTLLPHTLCSTSSVPAGVQYGNGWVIPTWSSVSNGVTVAGGLLSTTGVQTLSGPPQGVHLVPGPSQPPVQFTAGVQQQQGGSFSSSVHLGQSPSMPFIRVSCLPLVHKVRVKLHFCRMHLIPLLFRIRSSEIGTWIQDFITRRVLLRCDSTGDLYPVTKPSTIPHAFLTR